jgi:hypothetical protein
MNFKYLSDSKCMLPRTTTRLQYNDLTEIFKQYTILYILKAEYYESFFLQSL